MSTLAERWAALHERIARACEQGKRDPSSVRLLAVSKFQPSTEIRAAYALGQREFGENYAQELIVKAAELSDLPGLRFRFIGGLQRNKAKLLVPLGCAVETVASEALAEALAERARALGLRIEVMLQVNVAGDPKKTGVEPQALPGLVAFVRTWPELSLTGLMTIPKADDLGAARVAYRELRALGEAHGLSELSMGMSDDLEVAIQEGATRVRVGTALFGARPRRAPR